MHTRMEVELWVCAVTVMCFLRNRIPYGEVDGCHTVDHDQDTNDGSKDEPCGVVANPGEVQANLLTKVAPGGRGGGRGSHR